MAKLASSSIQRIVEGGSIRTTESQWLDQSDGAAALRNTGVGGMRASPDATNGFLASPQPIINWNMRTQMLAEITADANYMIASPPDLHKGIYTIDFTNPNTGGFVPGWGSSFVWSGDVEPQFNTAPGAKNIYQAYCDGRAIYISLFYQTPFIS